MSTNHRRKGSKLFDIALRMKWNWIVEQKRDSLFALLSRVCGKAMKAHIDPELDLRINHFTCCLTVRYIDAVAVAPRS